LRTETAPIVEDDRAFHIEQHGIDQIPDSDRWARPRDLFGLWAGASFQIEYFVYGVTLMTFGFTFTQAVELIILGNLSFLLVGVASLQGPQSGTTAMTINRAPFGANGARVIALFNWLTQVGFETEGLILVVLAAEVLTLKAGFQVGSPLKVAFVVVAVAIQLALPLLGHATIVKVLRALIVPFLALFAILAGFTLSKVDVHVVAHGPGWATFMAGLAFTVALSGLGWTENGNDYSRYLPRDARRGAVVGWVFLGTAVPEILVMILGSAVGTFTTSIATNTNPFAAFESSHVVPTGFVVPLLVVAILQLFAINSLDLYSSGVTLQTLGLAVKRWQAVVIDTVIACALTIYAVFDSSFNTLLKDFADVVIIWIAPWFAIYVTDWILRGRSYDAGQLQRLDRRSRYYGQAGGIRWSAMAAQLAGMAASLEGLSSTFHTPSWLTAIPAHTGGADFSIFTGMFVAAAVYLVIGRPRDRDTTAPAPKGQAGKD